MIDHSKGELEMREELCAESILTKDEEPEHEYLLHHKTVLWISGFSCCQLDPSKEETFKSEQIYYMRLPKKKLSILSPSIKSVHPC